ncbi:MAG TPA: POTRA domain-containing protein, partial [Thermodesulfobacteriota bacterium]|nr:POTRA domain-containing protein [Thermodesulfobacteriota bacterium]
MKIISRKSSTLIAVFLILISTEPGFSQEENDVTRISGIKIEGAKAVSKKEIKENIATEFPSIKPWVKDPEFDQEILRADMVRIKNLYANHGYYDAKAEYKLKFNENRSKVEVTINIEEGKPIILTELNIDLKGELDEKIRKKVLNSVPLKIDEVFSAIKYQRTKGIVSDILSDNGYPKAKIKGQALVNRQEKWAKATFSVTPGSLYRFGSISV